ncbi:chemotaxis protein CheW [Erythrobacter sp. SDW2]|uniref:chemotaxis protein CheW n=1 Tax=Erythrobacter sp. SDW2 TaxID=2907154 RepID=UPI001F193053|nr:chemotaxis protein CheW [Erythrobacter sp. SDW2]UIP07638.1 chemotaxis protein CheW [Erythrobacter sp. SDW2]
MNGELLLVASVAGRNIALPAADVASVSELEKITLVPRAPDWIEGIGAQRSRALTVVNCHRAIGLPGEARMDADETRCIVVKLDEHLYALRADRILDVTIAQSDVGQAPAGLGAEWRRVATGVIETVFGPAVMLDLAAIIAGPERLAA